MTDDLALIELPTAVVIRGLAASAQDEEGTKSSKGCSKRRRSSGAYHTCPGNAVLEVSVTPVWPARDHALR